MASEKAKELAYVLGLASGAKTPPVEMGATWIDAAVAPLLDVLTKTRKAWGRGDEQRSIAEFNRQMNEALDEAGTLLRAWGRK